MQPRVLVVDDDPVTRKLAETALKSRCQVTTARDGMEALDAARQLRPDLIISDLMMPVLDGMGLKRQLASDSELAWVPFIFLTARADEEAKLDGLLSGADDYLTKPVDPRTLRRRVEALLDRSRAVREASVERFTQEINAAFVPGTPPCIPGYQVAFAVEPATTGGGDIVDLLPLESGGVLLLQADVMGKGTRAKFFAYAFIGYLRGLLYASLEAVPHPAAMFDRLNALYRRDPLLPDIFVTGFLAHLDPVSHRLRTCRAGGIPGYVLGGSRGRVRRLEAGGGVPGLFPDAFAEEETVLEPGEALALVSDGVTEARDSGGTMLGEEAVGRLLASLAGRDAEGICTGLLAAVHEFAGGAPPHDDLTIVVLRREVPC